MFPIPCKSTSLTSSSLASLFAPPATGRISPERRLVLMGPPVSLTTIIAAMNICECYFDILHSMCGMEELALTPAQWATWIRPDSGSGYMISTACTVSMQGIFYLNVDGYTNST